MDNRWDKTEWLPILSIAVIFLSILYIAGLFFVMD